MNEVELLENLQETAKKISYDNKEEFDILNKRTEMLIRKLFGDESHYVKDLKNISYSPVIIFGGGSTDWRSPFEQGLKEFRTLIQVMLEDKKLSSNYEDSTTSKFIADEHIPQPDKKILKEIRVLIASPGDVIREREMLLDKLETKFRREHYEVRCGTRLIVDVGSSLPPKQAMHKI